MQPIITQVTQYQSDDGIIFSTEKECQQHELWLALKAKFGTYIVSTESIKDEYPSLHSSAYRNKKIFASLADFDAYKQSHTDVEYSDPIEKLFSLNVAKNDLDLTLSRYL